MADRLIVSNETYSAEERYELGIVHQLAEPGDGLEACREFIRKSDRRHAGLVGSRRAMKHTWALELDELNRITEIWADTARSEEHTSELQSLMRISYAVFCLKKKNKQSRTHQLET